MKRNEIRKTKEIEKEEGEYVFRKGNKLTTRGRLRMGQKDAV